MSRQFAFAVFIVIFFLACSFPASAATAPVVIDFETLARGEIVRDQFAARGIRVEGKNWSHGPDHAVVFDSRFIGASSDEDLEAPFDAATGFEGYGDLWPGNVLVLHENHDCDGDICAEPDDEGGRPAGYLEFRFAGPVTLHGMTVIDINYESDELPAQLVLFGMDGGVLASLDVPGVGGQGDWQPWEIEHSNVARARLYLPGDAAIDDLSFTPETPINWTPEINSFPPVAVTPDGVYSYRPELYDVDGDAIALALLAGPEGMTVADGELLWTAGSASGEFAVEIEAGDGNGGAVRQAFTVTVGEQFSRIQTFEFPSGTIVDSELLSDGLFVTARNLSSGSDFAVSFDTEAPTGTDTDLAAPFEEGSNNDLGFGSVRPGKVLILHEEHDCAPHDLVCTEPDDETTHPAGWIEFQFTQPANVFSIDVFDITSDDPAKRKVQLFDAQDQLLPLNLFLPRTGANDWDRLAINAISVSRMRVNFDGDGALDHLQYALVGDGVTNNQPPNVNGDSYSIEQDGILVIAAPGVLGNDSDPDGDELSATLLAPSAHGNLSFSADGSFTYIPGPQFVGVDGFSYISNDATHGREANVRIDVTSPLQHAVIHQFEITPFTVNAGQPVTIEWLTQNAEIVSISPEFESVPAFGILDVLPEQTTTYTLTATGSDGMPVTASRTVTVEFVTEPVVIEFLAPQNDATFNHGRPEMLLFHIAPDVGIDFSTLAISANGSVIQTQCLNGNPASTCLPTTPLPEGHNVLTATVRNTVGSLSNVASVSIVIDTIYPTAPIREKITLVHESENMVTVTGDVGSVEANATIIIRDGDSEMTVVADGNGAFQGVITADTGDELTVLVRDAAFNISQPESFIVPPPPLSVIITSLVDGAHVTADHVTVHGHHSGGGNTGVIVNGVRALVGADGGFVAVDVPLISGSNEIRVTATTFTGETADTVILVTSDAIPPLVSIAPSHNEGPGPLNVTFRIAYHGDPNALHHLELDVDGDGVSDEIFTHLEAELSHSYMQPGLYEPRLLVFTNDVIFEAATVIRVASDTEMDAMFRELWNSWKNNLVAGDIEAALTYISPARRERYRKLFDGLSGRWPQIFATFTGMEPTLLSSGFTEYAINRTISGENRLFLIYFVQDESGVWRLHSF